MTITGDHVRFDIAPGRRAVLNLPECVRTVQAIDVDSEQVSLLVRFHGMSVYVSPISPAEVEIIDTVPLRFPATEI